MNKELESVSQPFGSETGTRMSSKPFTLLDSSNQAETIERQALVGLKGWALLVMLVSGWVRVLGQAPLLGLVRVLLLASGASEGRLLTLLLSRRPLRRLVRLVR